MSCFYLIPCGHVAYPTQCYTNIHPFCRNNWCLPLCVLAELHSIDPGFYPSSSYPFNPVYSQRVQYSYFLSSSYLNYIILPTIRRTSLPGFLSRHSKIIPTLRESCIFISPAYFTVTSPIIPTVISAPDDYAHRFPNANIRGDCPNWLSFKCTFYLNLHLPFIPHS